MKRNKKKASAKPKKSGWKLVRTGNLGCYKSGLKVGDRLRLKKDIVVRWSHTKRPTGEVHRKGDIWTVLPGAKHEPDIIWLLKPDGKRATWSDSSIFERFELVPLPLHQKRRTAKPLKQKVNHER